MLPTLSPLGELISLFPDTLNFPLAFRLILGSKESQKSPKISTKKKSVLCVLVGIQAGKGWHSQQDG